MVERRGAGRWGRLRLACLLTALMLTVGCGSMSATRPRGGPQQPDGTGIYVGSIIVTGLRQSGPGMWLLETLGGNTYPVGTPVLVAINRWTGVADPDQHEETRLVNREGQTVASDTSQLPGTGKGMWYDPALSQTVRDVLDTGMLLPGYYEVVVLLGDREYARYGIRIVDIPLQEQGQGSRQNKQ